MELQISDEFFAEKTKAVEALYQVLDPELMVNVIDLGLIYELNFTNRKTIKVTMTLTSKGCPLGEAISEGVRNALGEKFPEHQVEVETVWEPQWTFEDISSTGREQLGF